MKSTTAEQFWRWFSDNEPRLRAAHPREATGEIEDQLRRIDPRLGVELGDGVPRELIFTAFVQVEAFSVVIGLVAAAPRFDGWKMVALKPPRGFDFAIEVGGQQVDASKITFEPLDTPAMPGAIGLRCFVEQALAEHENRNGILRLIIATGVGEAVAARISHVEAAPRDREPAEPLRIVSLADFILWHDQRTLKN